MVQATWQLKPWHEYQCNDAELRTSLLWGTGHPWGLPALSSAAALFLRTVCTLDRKILLSDRMLCSTHRYFTNWSKLRHSRTPVSTSFEKYSFQHSSNLHACRYPWDTFIQSILLSRCTLRRAYCNWQFSVKPSQFLLGISKCAFHLVPSLSADCWLSDTIKSRAAAGKVSLTRTC